MRRIALLVLVAVSFAAAIGVVLGGRGGAPDVTAAGTSSNCKAAPTSATRAPRTTAPRRLLGMWWEDSATAKGTLAEVDPRTLALGRRMTPGPFGSTWAFSPEGRQLALGGPEGAVRFVDLARMRRLGDLRPEGRGYVVALAWPSRDRLLAVEQWEGEVVRRSWLLVIPSDAGCSSGGRWRAASTRSRWQTAGSWRWWHPRRGSALLASSSPRRPVVSAASSSSRAGRAASRSGTRSRAR